MIRGNDFYAVWDEDNGRWSTDEDTVKNKIDRMMEEYKAKDVDLEGARILYMKYSSLGSIDQWKKYLKRQMDNNFHPLNTKLVFQNSPVCREDYSSITLPYSLEAGDYHAWDELVGTLYEQKEKHKIEWAIGSVVSGDSKYIQKFFVFYGDSGTGKSTVLNIIDKLFQGYTTAFDAKTIGMASKDFSLEAFKDNPLVAIQQDGDLSKIEDNTRLNSLISHETVLINEKHKTQYPMSLCSMLFMGTNKPVRITDSKSGIIRRLIDISPTGNKIPFKRYQRLLHEIDFELGAIAKHCLDIYEADPYYYDQYIPTTMISATNDFYNFMHDWLYERIKDKEYVTLNDAWMEYNIYADDAHLPKEWRFIKRTFKEELKNYFRIYKERYHDNEKDEYLRNVYKNLRIEKFSEYQEADDPEDNDMDIYEDEHKVIENVSGENRVGDDVWLKFNTTESLFDKIGADWAAQYAYIREDGTDQPSVAWDKCETILKDLNTSELHYVRCPEQFIIFDFDKKDPTTGEKSLELNIESASKFPPTYGELSKSGQGIHLVYIYNGDISKVGALFEKDVEIKVFTGKASLRRKLTRCNDLPISTISSGLPIRKERQKTIEEYVIKDHKHLEAAIRKALRKEISPFSTVCCVQYIGKVLNDAYNGGMKYDMSKLRPAVLEFAAASHNHSLECLDMAASFPYKSEEETKWVEPKGEKKIAFFDTEVFPNLFILVYKPIDEDCITLINPEPQEVLEFFQNYNAIGFNNLGYDNHICYARICGDSLYDLFVRSQNLINAPKGKNDWAIIQSKNLSYTDIFDFCSTKQGLKKWEISLQKEGVDIRHDEAGLPWDKPVPKNLWKRVAEYCRNDVIATEKVFMKNQSDFKAREILVQLANALRGPGSTVNDSTNNLTIKLIVGNEKNPQSLFVKPDLTKLFPGYEFSPYGIARERYMMEVDLKELPDNPKKYGLFEFVDGKYAATKDEQLNIGKNYYRNTAISGKSFYKGYDPGEGGFVYAEWGMYDESECYDSASHHPSSLIAENGFGPFTENFKILLDIRLHIKHKDYDWVRGLYGGILAPYLTSDEDAKQLSQALKIAINSVYGLTAAHFPNKLRDPRNEDNWVAKRGALFMIDLLTEVKKRGYKVIHVKTDSIKIANPDPMIFQFVYDYGKKFGYTFEVEHKFEKLCLVNNAVYVCKYTDDPANGKDAGKWDATGDQFKEPYVFKTLFTHEPLTFWDLTVTQTVKVGNGLYLDMNENLPASEPYEKEEEKLLRKWHKAGFDLSEDNERQLNEGTAPTLVDIPDKKQEQYTIERYHSDYLELLDIREKIAQCHDYHFIGKTGLFCPMKEGCKAGRLVRENNGKYAYAAGAKGYRWLEAEQVKELGLEDQIDYGYFEDLKKAAIDTIAEYGDFESFANNYYF